MEAASKNKKGRPSVFSREYGTEGTSQKELLKSLYPEHESERSTANLLYIREGQQIAINTFGEDQYKELFFPSGEKKPQGQAILEQIGRMRIQNEFPEEDCKTALEFSVNILWCQEQESIKYIEKILRKFRTGKYEKESGRTAKDEHKPFVLEGTYNGYYVAFSEKAYRMILFIAQTINNLDAQGKPEDFSVTSWANKTMEDMAAEVANIKGKKGLTIEAADNLYIYNIGFSMLRDKAKKQILIQERKEALKSDKIGRIAKAAGILEADSEDDSLW